MILKRWRIECLKTVCNHIKESWPGKRIIIRDIIISYNKFKQKLNLIKCSGLLDKMYKRFKQYWRRKTNYKGHWTIEMECERLFFSRKELYVGTEPFLRVYNICESLDCIEAKMETIGKPLKDLLTKGNLNQEQVKWELILKDNLDKICEEEDFIFASEEQ